MSRAYLRKWNCKMEEIEAYADDCQHMLRSMCFVVNKAQRRPEKPKWLTEIGLGGEAGEHEATDGEGDEVEDESESEDDADEEAAAIAAIKKKPACQEADDAAFSYKWNREIMRAERVRLGGLPEIALETQLPSGAAPGGADFEATFSDGKHAIPGFTNDDVRKMLAGLGGPRDTLKRLFESEHVATHNKIFLVQRLDHKLLCEMKEQSRSLTTVTVSMFGEVPVGPNGECIHVADDHPALLNALEFMKPLVLKYCADEVRVDQFAAWKKEAMKEMRAAKKKDDDLAKKSAIAVVTEPPAKKARRKPAVKAQSAQAEGPAAASVNATTTTTSTAAALNTKIEQGAPAASTKIEQGAPAASAMKEIAIKHEPIPAPTSMMSMLFNFTPQ
jgi:hypothetical protein